MLTIFSIPKAFVGHAKRHQRNALESWRQIANVQLILFGDDPGTREAAEEFSADHCADVPISSHGTPLLGAVFDEAQRRAKWPNVMYTNADMIYRDDIVAAIDRLRPHPRFLCCGQRIDLDVEDDIVGVPDGVARLYRDAAANGKLHDPAGSDYFIFPRGTLKMPPFVVGRPGWDNWLIYWARSGGALLVDATAAICAIHQNHDYSHSPFGGKDHVRGPEYFENIRLAGGYANMLDLRSAPSMLTRAGVRRKSAPKWLGAALRSSAVSRQFAAMRRRMRNGSVPV